MAIRGIVTQIVMFDSETFEQKYDFQNYFLNGRDLGFGTISEYNSFRTTPVDIQKTSVTQKFKITFSGTGANVDLVEEAIISNYLIQYVIWRWSDTEGLENPTGFNLFAECLASAEEGSSDFTIVTLTCSTYSKTVNADFPGRKIPWQILVPLALRKT